MSAEKQVCAVCGQGGYWVAYSGKHGENRCVNHLDDSPSVPALDGATNEPAPEVMLNNAGEFAARWNTLTPEQREALWKAMSRTFNDGYQCHVRDHEGMEHQFGLQARKLDHAKSELQGLLDSLDSHITHDEIYSAIQAVREVL